jgi:hypothetical protein
MRNEAADDSDLLDFAPTGEADDELAQLLPTLPPGTQVISVSYDLVENSGSSIFPGDRVDVLMPVPQSAKDTTSPPDGALLENIGVFAVGGDTISLVVTADQAQRLASRPGAATVRPSGQNNWGPGKRPSEGQGSSVIDLLETMRETDARP